MFILFVHHRRHNYSSFFWNALTSFFPQILKYAIIIYSSQQRFFNQKLPNKYSLVFLKTRPQTSMEQQIVKRWKQSHCGQAFYSLVLTCFRKWWEYGPMSESASRALRAGVGAGTACRWNGERRLRKWSQTWLLLHQFSEIVCNGTGLTSTALSSEGPSELILKRC